MTQLERNKHLLIWQRPEWPYFTWDSSALLDSLVKVRHQQGRLLALAQTFQEPDFKILNEIQKDIVDHHEMLLTKERLCGWQASLFPNGFSGIHRIQVGEFRGHDFTLNLKYTPPFAKNLNAEIKKFLTWWNEPPVALDGLIRAGIAYFWFMTIRSFEDGNSRLGKSLVDLALAQDEKQGWRAYDLKDLFVVNQQKVEELILSCQDRNGDITTWLVYFFEYLLHSIESALALHSHTSAKLLFFKKVENLALNSRQKKIISHLFSSAEIEKTITNRECVELCQTSRESIKRDLKQMVKWNLLRQTTPNGRSVCYRLI